MRLKRKANMIPRFSLPAYHRKLVEDINSSSNFSNKDKVWEFYTEEAIYCTLQTSSKDSISVDLQGISSEEVFTLRTKTPMYEAEDGTDFLGSGIYIPDSYFVDSGTISIMEVPSKGGWYNVIDSKCWNNGIFPHYECVVKKDNNAIASEYPTTIKEICDVSGWDTQAHLLDRSWVDDWEDN